MKMRFTNEWLRRRIERDADLDSDAGLPITKVEVLGAFLPPTPARERKNLNEFVKYIIGAVTGFVICKLFGYH